MIPLYHTGNEVLRQQPLCRHAAAAILLVVGEHHTAWNARRQALLASGASWHKHELLFVQAVLSLHPKSFAAWSYKRWVLQHAAGTCQVPKADAHLLGDLMKEDGAAAAPLGLGCSPSPLGSRLLAALGQHCGEVEMQCTEALILRDDNNYHAWAHRSARVLPLSLIYGSKKSPSLRLVIRLAMVQAFGLQEQELRFTRTALTRNVRNGSAWSQASAAPHFLTPDLACCD